MAGKADWTLGYGTGKGRAETVLIAAEAKPCEDAHVGMPDPSAHVAAVREARGDLKLSWAPLAQGTLGRTHPGFLICQGRRISLSLARLAGSRSEGTLKVMHGPRKKSNDVHKELGAVSNKTRIRMSREVEKTELGVAFSSTSRLQNLAECAYRSSMLEGTLRFSFYPM